MEIEGSGELHSMKPLEVASEVLAGDPRSESEEVGLSMVGAGGGVGFYGMAGYRGEELVDPRVEDGSSGCCMYVSGS